METTIAGIPCIVNVLDYTPSDNRLVRPTDIDPPEPEDWELEVLDTKGNRADWLWRKLTDDEERRIINDWLETYD
ncbi:MAG: hypothetical protein LC687_01265 [Actinobacteria bacterium]|nr:hypothetical protein [Actinomycetota bacterium]